MRASRTGGNSPTVPLVVVPLVITLQTLDDATYDITCNLPTTAMGFVLEQSNDAVTWVIFFSGTDPADESGVIALSGETYSRLRMTTGIYTGTLSNTFVND